MVPGASLLHYRLAEKIGEGGMGQVWRASDSTLGRDVAIKILPPEFAADPERLARFDREAKVLAALNHPNIAAIHGFHEAGGVRFLAMEMVPGEGLDQRISRGPIPADEAKAIALKISEALEYAHERGIVHRDLKPANIRITPDGTVKVLDFGLAKAIVGDPTISGPVSTPTILPTVTSAGTAVGMILGTAAYMSPEQARGKPVDRRADIWAFGVVAVEMLTGKRLFDGETVSDTIAGVLTRPIEVETLPYASLWERCLERDPKRRLRDIGEARIALEQNPVERREASKPSRLPWIVAAVAAMLAVAAFFWRPASAPPPAPPIRATLALPPTLELVTYDRSVALSPDGTTLALVAGDQEAKTTRIFLRDLSRLEVKSLQGTEGATYPFWSPDGKNLGFFAEGKLKRIGIADGIVSVLADAPQGRGGAWGRDGKIVFAPGAFGVLHEVADGGGTSTPLTKLASEGETQRLPQFLPDGRRVLYYSGGREQPSESGAWVFDPASGTSKQILEGETEAFYVEPGFLAFVRDANLMLQPFDLSTLQLAGAPTPLASRAQYDVNRNFLNLGISAGGRLVYQEVQPAEKRRLIWIDRAGNETPIPLGPSSVRSASVSRDGRRAALHTFDDHGEARLTLADLERGTSSPVGSTFYIYSSSWSPDGRTLALSLYGKQGNQLALKSTMREEEIRIVTSSKGSEFEPGSFTEDGRQLLYEERRGGGKIGELKVMTLGGDHPSRPYLSSPRGYYGPELSPDGRFAAFEGTGDDGLVRTSVSIASFPDAGAVWRITPTPAAYKRWGWLSPREIWWVDPERRLQTVTFRVVGDDVDVETPGALLGGRVLPEGYQLLAYVPARDRFLVATPLPAPPPPTLVVVSDWKSGLAR
ncbi:MAG TPA: protein kinase [Candidatus Polarisedimenticolaceae bacterium]